MCRVARMIALVRVLTGARVGHVLTYDGSSVMRVGRDTGLELRFDPRLDRDVSARHATISWDGERLRVTDLASRNGTYVNGRRIVQPTLLSDGDQVAFGASGPVVEIRWTDADRTVEFAASEPTIIAVDTQSPVTQAGGRAHDMLRGIRRWRWTALGLALALGGAVGLTLFRWGEQRTWAGERATLLAQVQTALATRDANAGLLGLADALRESRAAVREAATQLAAGDRGPDAARRRELRSNLRRALTTLGTQQAAAGLDRDMIRARNERAVAMVYVELQSGEVASGTAFAVRADGTLLTSAHVVSDTDGSAPRRIAAQFANSDQVWTARVLAMDPEHDLALIKIDAILGTVPTVARLNVRPDSILVGAPVLMIGYPLGGTLAPSPRAHHSIVAPLADAGTVAFVASGRFEVRGYGAAGTSGSPIFDSLGEVVGIAFGGRSVADVHYTVAVLSSAAAELLARTPR